MCCREEWIGSVLDERSDLRVGPLRAPPFEGLAPLALLDDFSVWNEEGM